MHNVRDKRLTVFGWIRRLLITVGSMLVGVVIALVIGLVVYLQSQPDLKIWHTAALDEEYTAESQVTGFADYLKLEQRLFAQLQDRVYQKIHPEDKHRVNRYQSGSLSDPDRWPNNWNRSFELSGPDPTRGALLLHGLSDSPYSLSNLAERLSASGVHVLGLRVPGHGTAPSGLVHVRWEDMAAAVKLAMRHLQEKLGDRPLYIVGYSNGGALAMHYVLSALEDGAAARVKGVVLISPEIAVTKLAAFAIWQARLGTLLGLSKFAWNSVLPEYDPFKYGSFAVNAGVQAHRLTGKIQDQLSNLGPTGALSQLPPILAFQSIADTTVVAPALIENLFEQLPQGEHELVLFDINQVAVKESLLNTNPRKVIASLLDKPLLSYRLTVITNQSASSRKVEIHQQEPGRIDKTVFPLNLAWPKDVYSLSHVALPFPSNDPLYGGDDAGESPGIQLGNLVLRGEHGLLRVNIGDLLRQRWNPFYDYLEQRVLQFFGLPASKGKS